MKKIQILMTSIACCVALQGCGSKQLAECPATTEAQWESADASSSVLINGYGAVYDTYIKVERRGGPGIDTSVCEMSRIYCPEPNADKGCQVFKCDYSEPSSAVVKVKDYQGEKYYNVPAAGRVAWDGQSLRCADL